MLEVDVFQIPGGRRTLRIDKSTIICGRSAKCDVVVRDPDVSRRHLRIELINGELWAEDMGSSNGSTLEGEPLATRSRVGEGQVLRVCDHEIRVRILGGSEQPMAGSISSSHPSASAVQTGMSHPTDHAPLHASASHAAAVHAAAGHAAAGHAAAGHAAAGHAAAPVHTAAAQYPPQQVPADLREGLGSGYPTEQTPPRQDFPQQQHPAGQSYPATYASSQPVHQPLLAPAPGRVDVAEDAPLAARSFQCGEAMWQSYEQMAREAGISVDELVNEALAMYGRQRVYASAGSANRPQTSLQFTRTPPHNLDLASMLVKPQARWTTSPGNT